MRENQTPKRSKSIILSHLAAGGLVLLEFIKVAVLAGVTIIFIRHFLFKPFYVKGASMEPNFHEREYLIIDELSYRFRPPERGEVVVFRYPDDPKEYFLKRIVGLPGERVKIAEGKVIIYNKEYPEGMVVDENYLGEVPTRGEKITSLGEDQYYVLGDNRDNSFDSRRFGAVDKEAMVGRVWLRGWPLNRAEIFNAPEFNL